MNDFEIEKGIKKSGFPIVRRAEDDAARKSVLVLFPLPALKEAVKITKKLLGCTQKRTP
jgi:hypothetical protein